MKTKKKTYLLLIVVISIWGTVAYRIISALNPELPQQKQSKLSFNNNYIYEKEIDTFSIQKVDRDPFLGTMYTTKTTPTTKPKAKSKVLWKPIEYLGMIANANTKEQIFIISINNNQVLLKKGQTKDSVKVIRGSYKTVTLKYKNQTKTLKLKS